MATTTSNLNLATEHGQPASMTKIIHSWEQETSLTLLYELPRTQFSYSSSAMSKFLRIPYCPPPHPPTKTFWSLPACMTWSTLSYHSCIPCSSSPQSVWVAFRCIKIPHPNSICWYCLQRGQDWPRLEKRGEKRSGPSSEDQPGNRFKVNSFGLIDKTKRKAQTFRSQ